MKQAKNELIRIFGTPLDAPAAPAGREQAAAEFGAAPLVFSDQPGLEVVLGLMEGRERFAFLKINHGFWERLARLERQCIGREEFTTQSGLDIDEAVGMAGRKWAEGGLLADLLKRIATLPAHDEGMHFVASLTPWPGSERIEGTPYENRAACESLIEYFVPRAHLDNITAKGFTGHEFKVAAITGSLHRFLDALRDRKVIFVGNKSNRALLDAIGLASLEVIEVHATEARLTRDSIRARLMKTVQERQNAACPPVILGAAGEALTTWLGLTLWDSSARFHFVDLGGTLAAYSPDTAMAVNWTRVYRRQLVRAIPNLGVRLPAVENLYFGARGLRDPQLVDMACGAGVPEPRMNDELPAPMPHTPVPFIENKVYDHQRLSELLSISLAANHHANFGPVAALLERMVASLTGQPDSRRALAVCNGTAALHMACGLHAYETGKPAFRWVTSAFSFFSTHVGPLADAIVIDCDSQGRFALDALKALPPGSYDGVIYTNVFAQQSDWDDIAEFCRQNGKRMVIDNATGLLDRPASARKPGSPIEIISAHHTKPWGVGEGGFILCDTEQERVLRDLANFAASMPKTANFAASNFKLSDLAAAAIIDRLERMPWWGRFYKWQERRMHSLMIDASADIFPFPGTTTALSPRAHTPFLCPAPVDIAAVPGPVALRKYYRPLPGHGDSPTPNAADLYARIFSLPNAPEMRLVPNERIIDQVMGMIAAMEKI